MKGNKIMAHKEYWVVNETADYVEFYRSLAKAKKEAMSIHQIGNVASIDEMDCNTVEGDIPSGQYWRIKNNQLIKL